MTYRAVLFDAGNTLIRVKTSVGEVYARTARLHGLEADGAEIDRQFREAFGRRKGRFVTEVSNPHSSEKERAWWAAVVEEVFRAAGLWERLSPGFESFFDHLYRAFEDPEVWEVFPDVLPCLDALAERGLLLGVVSNWDSRLHAVLRELGLAGRLRFALTSAEFGVEKPHPSIFQEAVRRFGVGPEEVLHVGDMERDDVQGATSAGLAAVLLDRASCPEGSRDRVCDLREVIGVVDGRPDRNGRL